MSKNRFAVALGKLAKGVPKNITPERREWLRQNAILSTKKRVKRLALESKQAQTP